MRPRPNDRGNDHGAYAPVLGPDGFNEAAAERPRKSWREFGRNPGRTRFNEAAAERPRK